MTERISISGKGKELFFGDAEQFETPPDAGHPRVAATHPATEEGTSASALPPSHPATMPQSAHGAMSAGPPTEPASFHDRLLDRLDEEHGLHYSYRFSRAEIESLRDAVYELEAKRGLRVTRNDVMRLGLNWILDDYQARGGESLLVQVIKHDRWRRRR